MHTDAFFCNLNGTSIDKKYEWILKLILYLNGSKNFMIKKMSKLQFQIADRLGAVCIKSISEGYLISDGPKS